ncbi:unnamed protein product [Rotaria sp. Silwood2]|nr:unnamed protein product [Rotaria sp. Silwood2]CAF4691719.1 unnamed protein product [Rotaria sp. Silwood2]
MKVDDVQVNFELDTSSPITRIYKHVWKLMEKSKLYPVKLTYNSYSDHSIPIIGKKMVKVNYNNPSIELKVIVGNTNRNNILGRNWIDALHFNNHTLADIISNLSIQNVNVEFRDLKRAVIRPSRNCSTR